MLNLKQFMTFQSGTEALDRVQKHVSQAVDPIVKLLHSWKLALSPDGWLQYDGSDLVDADSEQELENKTFTGGTISTSTTVSGTTRFYPALNSPWQNWGAPYRNLSYRKDQLGNLWIDGTLFTSTRPTAFGAIFTLPSGYYTPDTIFGGLICASHWSATDRRAHLKINNDGQVIFNEDTGVGVPVGYLHMSIVVPLR